MHSDAELAHLAVTLVAVGSHFNRATYHVSGVGVSYVSLRVLAAVEREPGLRVGELAKREGITQPSMSQAVKRLVDAGLVNRITNAQDARASDLTVTEAGRDTVQQYRAAASEKIVPVFRSLSEDDIETLEKAVEILFDLTNQLRQNLEPRIERS